MPERVRDRGVIRLSVDQELIHRIVGNRKALIADPAT